MYGCDTETLMVWLTTGQYHSDVVMNFTAIVDVVNRIRLVTAPEDIGTCDENCPCFQET